MTQYLIYGKRQGQKINGVATYDKTFRALDGFGMRVTKLDNAMSYATREDAQEIINKKGRTDCIFEIRKV